MARTKQTVCKSERSGEHSDTHALVTAIAEAQACKVLHAGLDNMGREIQPQGDGDGVEQQDNIFKDLENIDVTTHAALDEAGLLLATRTPIPLFGVHRTFSEEEQQQSVREEQQRQVNVDSERQQAEERQQQELQLQEELRILFEEEQMHMHAVKEEFEQQNQDWAEGQRRLTEERRREADLAGRRRQKAEVAEERRREIEEINREAAQLLHEELERRNPKPKKQRFKMSAKRNPSRDQQEFEEELEREQQQQQEQPKQEQQQQQQE